MYAYRIIDKVGHKTGTSKDELIGSKLSPLKLKHPPTRGNKHAETNIISDKKLLNKLNAQLIYNFQ